MRINKFKKVGKNKYKVFFDNEELILYEDIILKYDLLLKKDIDVYLLDEIINENNYYDAFNISLNYIEIKMRNRKEIKEYLSRKGFDDKFIDYSLEKLDKLNLINDDKYIEAFINDKINLTLDGPYKIRKNLLDYGMDEELINEYLYKIDNSIWSDKLDKLIDKKKSLMKNKSYYMFINKLKNDLYNLGYDSEMIDNKLSNIEYESDALDKDINKCIKKYKNDRNKIISSLLRKGYQYEEINGKLKTLD